jgi:SWI/SNF-related matrix-associated actin-dependent regulator of chromatin subfamily A member 5
VADVNAEQEQCDTATLINSSSKFIFLKRLLEEEVVNNQKKMLVFSGFDYALSCCQSLLDHLDIRYVRLDGRTSFALRKYNIHRFMHQPECQVFIMATRAGGEGITLTSAEVVVFLDLDFNPQVTAQAEARAHRLGQTKQVTVYKICTRGTVEAQIMSRVNKKVYLASKLLDNPNSTNILRSVIAPGNVEHDSTFLRNVLRPAIEAISVGECHPEQLLNMKWESVLELCKESEHHVEDLRSPPPSPLTPGSDWSEDEKVWLSRSAKINTGLFNGRNFRRPVATLKCDSIPADLMPEQRRVNKERVIYDEEIDYYVNKESTLCKPWEAIPTFATAEISSETKASQMKHLKVSRSAVSVVILLLATRSITNHPSRHV